MKHRNIVVGAVAALCSALALTIAHAVAPSTEWQDVPATNTVGSVVRDAIGYALQFPAESANGTNTTVYISRYGVDVYKTDGSSGYEGRYFWPFTRDDSDTEFGEVKTFSLATKEYVQAAISGGSGAYLPLDGGGTVTGAVDSTYSVAVKDWTGSNWRYKAWLDQESSSGILGWYHGTNQYQFMYGGLRLPNYEMLEFPTRGGTFALMSDVTNVVQSSAATQEYVTNYVSNAVIGKLDKAGGTITGDLTVSGGIGLTVERTVTAEEIESNSSVRAKTGIYVGDYTDGEEIALDFDEISGNARIAVTHMPSGAAGPYVFPLVIPFKDGTLALTSDVGARVATNALAGTVYNFGANRDIVNAIADVARALGATVTNAPPRTANQ